MLFPPRPRGRMNPTDLDFYEKSGLWCAQRKFNGTRNLIHITPERKLTLWNRHGSNHKTFSFNKSYREEILGCLNLEKGLEYWLDSELMNKQANATNEIILYDVLQAGRYFFGKPTQVERLQLLADICGRPKTLEPGGLGLMLTSRVWMAETFFNNFSARFKESLENPRLEGLVLRKKNVGLDSFGKSEKDAETGNIIRCRKPFSKTDGYNF